MSPLTAVRSATRAALRAVARDRTGECAGRSAVVLAPHPDDETLGCGATILRKVAAGTPVTIVVMTDGSASHRSGNISADELAALRVREMAEAAARLGIGDSALRWAGFGDGTLADHEEDAARYIGALLRELRPDEVYATSAHESHPDHASLGRAARAAVGDTASTLLLEYPVWLWNSWPVQRGHRVRSCVDALRAVLGRRAVKVCAGDHLAGKLHALQAHASQLARPAVVPPEDDWPVLPPEVLAAAGERYELFLPWAATGVTDTRQTGALARPRHRIPVR